VKYPELGLGALATVICNYVDIGDLELCTCRLPLYAITILNHEYGNLPVWISDLRGNALVTASSKGLLKESATDLAREGTNGVVYGRDEEQLSTAAVENDAAVMADRRSTGRSDREGRHRAHHGVCRHLQKRF